MKDYIDRLTDANSARERRQITRDEMGMQDPNIGSMAMGFLAGLLFSSAARDLLGDGRRDDYDPYGYDNDSYRF